MSYLDTYKKRLVRDGGKVLEARTEIGKRRINDAFTMTHGYKKAILKESYDEKPREIDIVVKSSTSELEKRFLFRPDTKVATGAYISYDDKTYIVRELDVDQISPKGVCFYCNRFINFKGADEPLYCYTNSTTYGSKGILDQDKFYELDSKTKIYIQKNRYTDTLQIGQRIMFANRYVYKITELDDLVYSGLYIIVAQRDETLPMDDFKNNLAHNNTTTFTPVEDEEGIKIEGADRIKVGGTEQYSIQLTGGTWVIDDEKIATLVINDGIATLSALKVGWVTLSYVLEDATTVDLDIMCSS